MRSALISWLLVLVAIAGCSERPRAPALTNEPVYVNDREGLRFSVPESWAQIGSGNHPKGKIEKDFLLCRYMRKPATAADKQAMLEVNMVDLPASTDLVQHFAEESYGSKRWQLMHPATKIQANGVEAERYVLQGRIRNDDMTKDVVVFHRGERTYFFIGVYAVKDTSAEDQFRRAVESTTWKQ